MNFLVIGEKCRDVFVYGEVTRLSPEAPVPIFKPNRITENGGMAQNVYNNLFSLIEKSVIINNKMIIFVNLYFFIFILYLLV